MSSNLTHATNLSGESTALRGDQRPSALVFRWQVAGTLPPLLPILSHLWYHGSMPELLPSQTYKPVDFSRELDYIHKTCKEVFGGDWRGKCWQDSEGNIFKVDCVELTITVN